MKQLLKNWLNYQCIILNGTIKGTLLSGPLDIGPYNQGLFWPKGKDCNKTTWRVVQVALKNRKAVIQTRTNKIEETGEPLDTLACPLFLNGKLLGCIAIEITTRSRLMQQEALKQIQFGANWLEAIIKMHASSVKTKKKLINLVKLISTGLEDDQFKVAATSVTNELAELFSCHRVSLGFSPYKRLRIEAISHSSNINPDSNIIRAIHDAMRESLDQGASIVYPAESDDAITINRFHKKLAEKQQGSSICSVPLAKNTKAVGALLFERSLKKPFDRDTVKQCEQISLLLGPVLEIRRHDEQSLILKITDSLRSLSRKLFGLQHMAFKVASCLFVFLLLWLCLAGTTFRISANSVLEAKVRRMIIAPQQGYIAEAHARAGDFVHEGDLLATLEGKELRFEKQKWQSQLAQLVKEYRKALAGLDRSELAILNAKQTQAQAQLRLVEQQLERTILVAPFSGLVVKGDLSQELGSPVERGQVLYEVAPTNEYRVVLKIDDRDIGWINIEQKGKLKLSGIPDKSFNITIDRLTPVSSSEEGRNYFRIEAIMDSHSDLMRPGMEGIAKIDIDRKKMVWVWTRRFIEWLRLFAWNWLP